MKPLSYLSLFLILTLSFFYKKDLINTNLVLSDSLFLKAIGTIEGEEIGYDLVKDEDNNFWINGRQDNKSLLLKVDADGNLLEKIDFNITNGNDFFYSSFMDSEGMLLVPGRDELNSATENFLLKVNPTTQQVIWAKSYPTPAFTRLEKITEILPNGNYVVAGMVDISGEGNNIFLMEVDKDSGNSIWQRSYHLGTTDIILQLKFHDNALYACGVNRDGGLDKIRPFALKFDLTGNIIWSKYFLRSFSESGRLYITDFLIKNDRIYGVLRGSFFNDDLDNSKAYFIELDLDGNLLFAKEFIFSGNDPISGLRILSLDNGFILRGNINTSPSIQWFMRLDENFNSIWAVGLNSEDGGGFGTTILDNEIYFSSFSSKPTGNNKRDIIFGKINIDVPPVQTDCDWYFDLIVIEEEITNPFQADINFLESSINNNFNSFSITPSEPDLMVNDVCECVELEICDNNLDDDGDGLIDCEDPDLQDSCCCLVPIPLDLGPDMSFCENENFLLDAGNDYVSYTWQDGFQNQNYAVTETGIYSVEVVDDCGVIQSDSVAVTALNSPFTMDTLMICQGDTAFIFGNPETESGDYMSIVSGQNGCDSTHRTTLQVVEMLQSFEQLTICPGDSVLIFGNFETIAADYVSQPQMSEAGCDSIHTISLQIVSEMSVDFQILPTCENEDNGFVQAVVSGGVAPYQYFWENSNQTTDTLSNLAIGEYGLTVTDDFGCQLATTFIINSVADQMLDITVVDESCFGFQDGILMIEDATIGLNYSLDGVNFDTTTTFSNLPPDTYTLTALANNGCSQTLDFTVENASEIILNLPPDTTLCLGDSLRLLPQTNTVDNLVYQWTPPFGLSCIDCPTPFARPFSNVVYSLLITDENGCTATDSMAINITFVERLFAPNVFSPNNDGINDYFYLQSDKGVKEILEFKIFGRWGQLIFETSNIQPNNPQMGWDGFFKNEKLNPDVFVWMAKVEFLNGTTEIFKGDILLIK